MVLFNYATKEITAKIVYYGPGLCGKTTNLKLIHQKLNPKTRGKLLSLATETDRTLFFDFLPVDLGTIRGYRVRFQLYTVPGQVHYNATRRLVLKGADAVVFVADSQIEMMEKNVESLENLKENLVQNGLDPATIPQVMQYNKRDLPNISPVADLERRLNPTGLPHHEAIASDGDGVLETLKAITKLLMMDLKRKHDFMGKAEEPEEEKPREIKGPELPRRFAAPAEPPPPAEPLPPLRTDEAIDEVEEVSGLGEPVVGAASEAEAAEAVAEVEPEPVPEPASEAEAAETVAEVEPEPVPETASEAEAVEAVAEVEPEPVPEPAAEASEEPEIQLPPGSEPMAEFEAQRILGHPPQSGGRTPWGEAPFPEPPAPSEEETPLAFSEGPWNVVRTELGRDGSPTAAPAPAVEETVLQETSPTGVDEAAGLPEAEDLSPAVEAVSPLGSESEPAPGVEPEVVQESGAAAATSVGGEVAADVATRLGEAVEALEAHMQILREENRIFRETLGKLAMLLAEQQSRAKRGDEELLRMIKELAGQRASKGLFGRLFS